MEPLSAASAAALPASHVVTKPVTSSPPSFRLPTNPQLLREGRVMRSIVRSMVENMETVLGDLRGIMGDIKSLVVQIDTVTDKIDQKYSEVKPKPRSVEHVVKKPRCVHIAKTNSSSDDMSTMSSANTMIIHSLPKDVSKQSSRSGQSVFARDRKHESEQNSNNERINDFSASTRRRHNTTTNILSMNIKPTEIENVTTLHKPKDNEVHNVPQASSALMKSKIAYEKEEEKKQKSNNNSCPKDEMKLTRSSHPAPTTQLSVNKAVTQQNQEPDWSARSNSFKVHPRHGAGSHAKHRDNESRKSWPNDIPLPFNLLKKKERKSISPPDETHIGVINPAIEKHVRKNQRVHINGRKRPPVGPKVKNVAVSESTHQVLKPDLQSPKSTLQRRSEKSESQERIYEEIPTMSKQKQSSVVVNKAFQAKTPTESRSPITHIGMSPHVHVVKKPNVDSSSQEDFSLSYRPKANRVPVPPRGSGSLPNSPKSKHSSREFEPTTTWTLVSKLSHSPVHNRQSPSPVHKKQSFSPVFKKASQSPVSKRNECHLYQSLESDLDSESASAVGEYNEIRSMTPDMDWSYLGLVGNQAECCFVRDEYEIPVGQKASNPKNSKAKGAALFPDSPEIVSKVTFREGNTPSPSDSQARLTSTFHASIASVIEKICKSPTVNHVFCSEVASPENEGYCGCYEAVVDSVLENISGFESIEDLGNEFEDVVYETYVSFDDEFEDDDWDVGLKRENVGAETDGMSLIDFAVDEFYEDDLFFNSEIGFDSQEQMENYEELNAVKVDAFGVAGLPSSGKRKLSPRSPDFYKSFSELKIGDLRSQGFQRCSFTEDDCCAMKPIVPSDQSNFTLWPKLHSPGAASLSNSADSQDMHSSFSSDELSLRLRDSDSSNSNMSFSSPDLAACSPDTDVFVTSSDADDIFRSREECPSAFSSVDSTTDNKHRQNIMQLRRDFFDSVFKNSETTGNDSFSELSNKSTTGSVSVSLDQDILKAANENFLDNVSDSGSYNEDRSHYNRNVNTWTAYTMVHMQADDVSDTASDILNDNNSFNNTSLTSSYIDADNLGVVQANQSIRY